MLNWRGFTLVEISVAILIIILLSTIIFANYRAGSQQYALQRSASKLTQDIRRAEEMAMSAKECSVCAGQISGYGIYFDTSTSNKYLLYADAYPRNEFYIDGEDTPVGTIELEKGVFVSKIEMYDSPGSYVPMYSPQDKLSINFASPNPEVKIRYNQGDDAASAMITLTLESSSKSRFIVINRAGLVYIDETPGCWCWYVYENLGSGPGCFAPICPPVGCLIWCKKTRECSLPTCPGDGTTETICLPEYHCPTW